MAKLITGDQREEPYQLVNKSSDTAILIVHGYTAGPQSMNSLARRCGEVLKVGIKGVQLPGHNTGNSNNMDESSSELWIRAVADELTKLKSRYKHVFIMGQSMGGALSIIASSRQKVDGVILLNPLAARPSALLRFSKILLKLVRFHVPSGVDEREWTEDYFSNKTADEMCKVSDLAENAIKKVTAPVALMVSTHDKVVPNNSRENIQQNVSSKFLRIFEYLQSGHVLSLSDEQDNVVNDIASFVNAARKLRDVESINAVLSPENLALFSAKELQPVLKEVVKYMDSLIIISPKSHKYTIDVRDLFLSFCSTFVMLYGYEDLNYFLQKAHKCNDLAEVKAQLLRINRTYRVKVKSNYIKTKTSSKNKSIVINSNQEEVERFNRARKDQITVDKTAELQVREREVGLAHVKVTKSKEDLVTLAGNKVAASKFVYEQKNYKGILRYEASVSKVDGAIAYTQEPEKLYEKTFRFASLRHQVHKIKSFAHKMTHKSNLLIKPQIEKTSERKPITGKNNLTSLFSNDSKITINSEDHKGLLHKHLSDKTIKSHEKALLSHSEFTLHSKQHEREKGVDRTINYDFQMRNGTFLTFGNIFGGMMRIGNLIARIFAAIFTVANHFGILKSNELQEQERTSNSRDAHPTLMTAPLNQQKDIDELDMDDGNLLDFTRRPNIVMEAINRAPGRQAITQPNRIRRATESNRSRWNLF